MASSYPSTTGVPGAVDGRHSEEERGGVQKENAAGDREGGAQSQPQGVSGDGGGGDGGEEVIGQGRC